MECIDPLARCWNKAQTYADWEQDLNFVPAEPPGWLTWKFEPTDGNVDILLSQIHHLDRIFQSKAHKSFSVLQNPAYHYLSLKVKFKLH